MIRSNRRSAFTMILARLTLAAFAATLPGPAVWGQVAELAAPLGGSRAAISGALVALIAATLLRMSMLRYTMAARGAKVLQEKRYDQAALNAIITNWNLVNTLCANNVPNYVCAPASAVPPGVCGCTCAPTLADFPTVTTSLAGGSCQLNIQSTDLP